MSNPIPTGTVTFLFTDIEDSTLLAQQYFTEMPSLLAQHHAILHQSIQAYNGHVFRIVGDAFSAAFLTASDALQAALRAQRQLQQADWDPAELKVRMGIHTGPAQAVDIDASDYTGYLTLTRVQRVMSIAYGGQILVSSTSAELLRGELLEGVGLGDLGEHRLKGLLNPEHLWQVTAVDLLSEFPPLPSLKAIPSNLPLQLSSFVGREHEIAEALRLLQTTRLLTLTGVGGVGKTRLALQAASETVDAFPDGVWLVELAPLADPALLFQRVAAVLGVREVPGRSLSVALVDYLRAKNLLLLLDNCEHLIEACAQLADSLLHTSPDLHIMASSREALGITGETILQVPSLGLPDLRDSSSVEDLARSEAVQLFLERACAVQPGFALTEGNARIIAQICQRLDGIPLAIELAAARIKMFSAEQILARLDDRFRLLTGGSRTALPRQQTLRALIDWSYDLLPEAERVLLRRLSVFSGGWTFETAEAVVGQKEGQSFNILDLLTHLIDKSLVMVDEPHKGETTRYRFLETIRQYALEKLLESGEAARVRDRHLDFFRKFAEETEPKLLSSEQLRWLDRIETEHDNLRAALAWGLENDPEAALRLAGAVWYFWNMRGYVGEGRGWLARALDQVEALPPLEDEIAQERMAARARALLGLGTLMISQGNNSEAMQAFQESEALARQIGDKHVLVKALGLSGTAAILLHGNPTLGIASIEESAALSREIGDKWSLAMALGMLSHYALASGDVKAARTYLQESLRLSRATGDPWNTAMTMMGFGIGAGQQGDFTQARARFEESLAIFREIGDKYRVNMALSELAHLERRQGHYEQAVPHYRETILAWQELGHRGAIAHQLESFAFIAAAQGDAGRAAQLLGSAEALRETIATPMTPLERGDYDSVVASMRSRLDEALFEEAWEKGRALTMEDAIAYALEPVNAE